MIWEHRQLFSAAACNPFMGDVNEEDDADDAGYEEEDDGLDMPNSSQHPFVVKFQGLPWQQLRLLFKIKIKKKKAKTNKK